MVVSGYGGLLHTKWLIDKLSHQVSILLVHHGIGAPLSAALEVLALKRLILQLLHSSMLRIDCLMVANVVLLLL